MLPSLGNLGNLGNLHTDAQTAAEAKRRKNAQASNSSNSSNSPPSIPIDFGQKTLDYFEDVGMWNPNEDGDETLAYKHLKHEGGKYVDAIHYVYSNADEKAQILKSIMFSKDDVWVFQALGTSLEYDGSFTIKRFRDEDVKSWVGVLKDRYAFKEVYECGSYNCFFKDVDTSKDNMLKLLEIATWDPNVAPRVVSVRAPRIPEDPKFYPSRSQRLNELIVEFDELMFTLAMAQASMTPPIYAAFPARFYDKTYDAEYPVQTSFVYITEVGWTNLSAFLKRNTFDSKQRISLGKEIFRCVDRISVRYVILTDIKLDNMVVKPVAGDDDDYEVRMIDFGSNFSAKLRSLKGEYAYTSQDCVFFVNALLLLNSVIKLDVRATIFQPLAEKAVSTWKQMRDQDEMTKLCGMLADDRWFAEQFENDFDKRGVPYRNEDSFSDQKAFRDVDEFYEKLAKTFYAMLYHYGRDGSEFLDRKSRPNPDKLQDAKHYVDRLVDKLPAYFYAS